MAPVASWNLLESQNHQQQPFNRTAASKQQQMVLIDNNNGSLHSSLKSYGSVSSFESSSAADPYASLMLLSNNINPPNKPPRAAGNYQSRFAYNNGNHVIGFRGTSAANSAAANRSKSHSDLVII